MTSSKFPAQFLSAYDIGKRVRVVSLTGAIVTDILTGIKAYSVKETGEPKPRLVAEFQSVMHHDPYGRGGIEIALDSWAKRWDS